MMVALSQNPRADLCRREHPARDRREVGELGHDVLDIRGAPRETMKDKPN